MAKKRSGKRDHGRRRKTPLHARRGGRGGLIDLLAKGKSLARDLLTKVRTRIGSSNGHRGDQAA
jgi:hypothetical protein